MFKKSNYVKKKLIWLIGLLIVIGLTIIVGKGEFNTILISYFNNQKKSQFNFESTSNIIKDKIGEVSNKTITQPLNTISNGLVLGYKVHIRTGIIVSITPHELIVEVPKLVGEGNEIITALINPNTPIIEVQIPTLMSPEHTEAARLGEEIINRVLVDFKKLKIGQLVSILSLDDMASVLKVQTARIEYKIFLAS